MLQEVLTVGGCALIGGIGGYYGQCKSGTCPLTSTWWRGALYGAFIGMLFALNRR